MLSGVRCVAKRSGDVGVFGVPVDAGRGGFQGGEEKQEREVWPPRWQHGSFLWCGKRRSVCNSTKSTCVQYCCVQSGATVKHGTQVPTEGGTAKPTWYPYSPMSPTLLCTCTDEVAKQRVNNPALGPS